MGVDWGVVVQKQKECLVCVCVLCGGVVAPKQCRERKRGCAEAVGATSPQSQRRDYLARSSLHDGRGRGEGRQRVSATLNGLQSKYTDTDANLW